MYRIGLDISGGDYAPEEIFKGAVAAKEEFNAEIVLIGIRSEIEGQARRSKVSLNNFAVIDAPEKISMSEPPAVSVRKKKQSSIVVGAKMLKDKEIDAFVSCGNTGAVVCAATLLTGLIEGIERPGIGLIIPTVNGRSLVIDVGANIDPKPIQLLQYGLMANVYYAAIFNKENPSLGLLNIGEEESKGTEFFKEVHHLFSQSQLNFIGNVEARDVFSHKTDCIICDGLVGNIALKVAEGFAEAWGTQLIRVIKKDFWGRLGLFLAQSSLRKFKKIGDYSEYGGAPLLGVNGIVIIGHGRSNAKAVKNAVRVALKELNSNVIAKIKRSADEFRENSRLGQIRSA